MREKGQTVKGQILFGNITAKSQSLTRGRNNGVELSESIACMTVDAKSALVIFN